MIKDLPENEMNTFYGQGEFVDLCVGSAFTMYETN